mmetsp:Transcript_63050/g.199540  ORF Transcript_63050/g.199540 Transcript_63050/m.199540 type:complete len:336 (-) Transcript_63050:172-1179(-)
MSGRSSAGVLTYLSRRSDAIAILYRGVMMPQSQIVAAAAAPAEATARGSLRAGSSGTARSMLHAGVGAGAGLPPEGLPRAAAARSTTPATAAAPHPRAKSRRRGATAAASRPPSNSSARSSRSSSLPPSIDWSTRSRSAAASEGSSRMGMSDETNAGDKAVSPAWRRALTHSTPISPSARGGTCSADVHRPSGAGMRLDSHPATLAAARAEPFWRKPTMWSSPARQPRATTVTMPPSSPSRTRGEACSVALGSPPITPPAPGSSTISIDPLGAWRIRTLRPLKKTVMASARSAASPGAALGDGRSPITLLTACLIISSGEGETFSSPGALPNPSM